MKYKFSDKNACLAAFPEYRESNGYLAPEFVDVTVAYVSRDGSFFFIEHGAPGWPVPRIDITPYQEKMKGTLASLGF